VDAKAKRDKVRLGIICPKWLSKDLKARPSEFDEAIELLDEVAPRWDTNVLHHGAVEGRDCFHNVDVLLILGDAIPNVGERRAWAEALVLAGATDAPDGDELNAMLTDYAGNQAEGRARGIRRNGDTPCTIIRAGRRLAGAQTVIPLDKRRLPSPVALAAELAAGALFRKHGGCTAEMVLAAITAERDKAPRDGLAGYLFRSWDSRARARRVCVDPRSKQTPQAAPAQRDKVHAGMAAAALRWGAVRLDLPNRAGVGRPVLAWVLPERKDDFMEWWQSRDPEPTAPKPEPDSEPAPDPERTEPKPEPEPEPAPPRAPVCGRYDRVALSRIMRERWKDLWGYVQERARIREIEGGQPRPLAEQGALCDLAEHLGRENGVSGLVWTDFEAWERQGLFAEIMPVPTRGGKVRGIAHAPPVGAVGAWCC